MMITRRAMIGSVLAAIPAAACSKPAKAAEVTIYKSPACGCCGAWVEHIQASGLKTITVDKDDVTPIAKRLGVPDNMRSCHTALIDGYFVEGHVPAPDIKRLIAERPAARGIAVPGMPVGSPGMEQGDRRDDYDTFVIDRKGAARVYARHNRV